MTHVNWNWPFGFAGAILFMVGGRGYGVGAYVDTALRRVIQPGYAANAVATATGVFGRSAGGRRNVRLLLAQPAPGRRDLTTRQRWRNASVAPYDRRNLCRPLTGE